MNNKIERLNHTFVREISYILSTEVKDKNIHFITITGCKITNDLSFAKVYFTVLDENQKEDVSKALKKASSFIRGKLSERVEIRHTPELIFIYDDSIAYGNKIEEKLKQLKNKE